MDKLPKEIITQFKNGDLSVFPRIFNTYKDIVFAFSLSIIKQREDAEDCTQEIFMHVIDKISLFNEDMYSFEAWLIRLSRNYTYNYIRDNKKEKDHVIINEDTLFTLSLPKVKNDDTLFKDINLLLGDELYQIFYMRLCLDFSYRKISEIIDMPRETVRLKYKDAYSLVKKTIKHI